MDSSIAAQIDAIFGSPDSVNDNEGILKTQVAATSVFPESANEDAVKADAIFGSPESVNDNEGILKTQVAATSSSPESANEDAVKADKSFVTALDFSDAIATNDETAEAKNDESGNDLIHPDVSDSEMDSKLPAKPATDPNTAVMTVENDDISYLEDSTLPDKLATYPAIVQRDSMAAEKTKKLQTKPVIDQSILESFLELSDTESVVAIQKEGFILRTLDAHEAFLPEKYKKKNDEAKRDYLVKYFRKINQKQFPRKVYNHSRTPFCTIDPKQGRKKFMEDLKSIFFTRRGFSKDANDSFKKSKNLKIDIIGFNTVDTPKSVDRRIQVEFKDGSAVFESVKTLLTNEGLLDTKEEILDDVSLIIGGSVEQEPHGDHPRLFCHFDCGDKKEYVGYELNRKKYNDSISSKYAPSSIICDMSNDSSGFYMAIPDCYLNIDNKKQTAKIKFGRSNEKYAIHEIKEYSSLNTGVVFNMVTIKVEEACRFVGDFMHAGGNNVSKLDPEEEKQFHSTYESVWKQLNEARTPNITTIKNAIIKFDAVKNVTRFFCKTIPKAYAELIPRLNIYFLYDNKCEYSQGKDQLEILASVALDQKSKMAAKRPRDENAEESSPKKKEWISKRYKHLAPHQNALMYAVRPENEVNVVFATKRALLSPLKKKSEQRRKQREAKRISEQKDQLQEKSLIELSQDQLIAAPHAFSEYFRINDFKTRVVNASEAEFEKELTNLSTRVFKHIVVSQKQIALSINHKSQPQGKYVKCQEWYYDIDFADWFKEYVTEDQRPLVSWTKIKKLKEQNRFGVFAARSFVNGEVIALFWGNRVSEDQMGNLSSYALESKYGVYDPVRGLGDSGEPIYAMGMHMAIVSPDVSKVNAFISEEFVVYAAKTIPVGQEIVLGLEDGVSKKHNVIVLERIAI